MADALRTVPRHEFVPAASADEAYANKAVITKRDSNGAALSCASMPTVVAMMLDQLDVQPGQRILEIGAGTGYNAALLATLVGPDGEVTTVDINADVTAAARRNLDDTGFHRVRVLTRDGAEGAPEHGPYDRVIVTVGAWDLPPAWWDQLVPGGRLVVPLRWRGTTRALGLTKAADRWVGDWVFLCGFVPMVGQPGERRATVDPAGLVAVHYDVDQPVDVPALRGVLDRERTEVWSAATVHAEEPFDRVWPRLSAVDDRTVRIEAAERAVRSGLCTPAIATRSPALVCEDSLAYFTVRRCEHADRWRLGAVGHGRRGYELASRIVEQIDLWDRDRTADPDVLVFPAGGPLPDGLSGKVIVKPHSRLVIRYRELADACRRR